MNQSHLAVTDKWITGFEFDEETETNYSYSYIYDCAAIFWSARCQPRFGIVLKRCLHTALRKTLRVKNIG